MSRQFRILSRSLLRQTVRAAEDSRGIALITAALVVFAVGMMLFGFMFINQSEIKFAALSRSSTQALALAEAGTQEAVQRLSMFGGTPGSTQFSNSLASGTGATGTVRYQAALASNPQIFPILSISTFAGAQRAVRVFVRTNFKSGFSNVIAAPQVNVQSNFADMKGDTYAQGNILFQSGAIQCGIGATATNLVPPQLSVGTTIGGQGAAINPLCGASAINGTFSTECASGSLTEVAPTPCPRPSDGSGNLLPVHYHPMVPIGMPSADFNTVVTAWNGGTGTLPTGMTVVQATQNGAGVTYASAGTYTPAYWTSMPTTNGKVMLITAAQPFCVNFNGSVSPPAPAITGGCLAGSRYGNQTGTIAHATRFLDWGLVKDDLTRTQAVTFFQAPLCTAPCANPGNQNGIRYIPLIPPLNILVEACVQHVNPGTNVFDQVNTADGVNCASNPAITTISSTTVTFTGTKNNPEALVIDNKGAGTVSITGSLPPSTLPTCASASSFDAFNWGMIFASGDITFPSNFALTGFIYVQGNISAQSDMALRGGIFTPTSTTTQLAFNTPQSNMTFCGGQVPVMMTPVFVSFSAITWQDRPMLLP